METNTPERLNVDAQHRPTPEQWGFVAHQLGELTPDTLGVRRP